MVWVIERMIGDGVWKRYDRNIGGHILSYYPSKRAALAAAGSIPGPKRVRKIVD